MILKPSYRLQVSLHMNVQLVPNRHREEIHIGLTNRYPSLGRGRRRKTTTYGPFAKYLKSIKKADRIRSQYTAPTETWKRTLVDAEGNWA